MDEDSSSWIQRTKYSQTVFHRLDSSRLASASFSARQGESPSLRSRPEISSEHKKPEPISPKIQLNPLTNKQRSLSPLPETSLSESFKEARSEKKRFSTPHPKRNNSDKGMGKYFSKVSVDGMPSNTKATPNSSPLGSLSPFGKYKSKKDSSWSKYFDNGGGKVTAVEAVDEHLADLSQLFLGLKFAHGAHSRLYHGIYQGETVAVKIIRVPDDDENGVLATRLEKQFSREVTLLSRLHHTNVLKFVAACRQPPVYCIITDYVSQGSLRAYLHKLEHNPLPLDKLIPIAIEIARGMEYVHSKGVIHRDLKPENILIDENFHMIIADFGIACEEIYCDPFADDPGTYRWMAPEMVKIKNKKSSYGRKVDVYSLGLILWEMVSGRIPYEDKNPIQAAFAVVNKKLRPSFPEDCPSAMKALIEQCWSTQPDKRPEFWQIVKVLEECESSLALDGTLNTVHNSICEEHKKGFLHWVQKLAPPHSNHKSMPKPKFM